MLLSARRLALWALGVLLVLMIPLVAMQFSSEVNWDLFDFVIMGAILMAVGLVYELIVRKSEKRTYRVAFGIAIVSFFLLFWVNAAVGIIGNEGQSANLLYGAVIAIVLAGGLLARFKPMGMARTLFIAAGAQMLAPVLALLIWPPPETSWSPGVFQVFMLTAFFAFLFVLSGVLFKRSIR